MQIQEIKANLKDLRSQLIGHPLYKSVESPQDLQIFMKHHVFAVWDFMSLLKTLQIQLTCTKSPWTPVGNPQHRYLINEIVLAEETDLNAEGERQSHYEMYLDAMEKAGASTEKIQDFVGQIQHGTDVFLVIATSDLPESVKEFLLFTFNTIKGGKAHEIAACFTFGREELIPDMFTSIIGEIQQNFPEEDLSLFKYYFDRHIELDEDEHGPMALALIAALCGDDAQKWREVEVCSREALEKRLGLWDGIAKEINYYKAIA
ncbi:DUF3050 domain-containing protein [Psychroflexus lacisalsi]|jgi:hypothetical protein|uniref:DUF3050 domain-containing protein n=1 Tax=Psychroflexus lacisalsi TaxID=503928 RepID=A0ABP3VIQ7_9FLAO|nr:DUF3050 domain-containing protein [Psychroflexus lacisalsi]MBZ9621199.1 DUF3050 domain-containing protein [Psychroflexus lacisalsi]